VSSVSEEVEAVIDCNTVDPCLDGRLKPEGAEACIEFDEYFLCKIARVRLVAGVRETLLVQLIRIASVQSHEISVYRRSASGLKGADEIFVGCIVE
jgi:hypothetical protein